MAQFPQQMLGAERREAGGESEGSFWSGGDREARRRWEPGEERETFPGEVNEVAERPQCRGERGGQTEVRPTVLGGGSPRRELDAVVPPTTTPSLFSPQSQFLPHAIFPVPHALGQESLPQKPLREPPPSSRTAPPRYPHQEAAVQGRGTLACPDLSVCFPKSRSSLTCLPSFYRLLCSAHTQSILVD